MTHRGGQFDREVGCERPEGALARLLAETLERPVLGDPEKEQQRRLLIARVARHLGRLREAEDHYAQLLRRDDASAELWAEAAALAEEMGETAQAAERYRTALADARDGAEVEKERRGEWLRGLAVALMHAGRCDQAGRCWWRLARQNTQAAEAWAGLWVCAWIERRRGVAERAEGMLSRHTPKAIRRVLLAELWQHAATQAGHIVTRPALRVVREHSPLRALLRSNARVLRDAAEEHPMRADVRYHLACLEDALGDVATARQQVREALFINPRYVAAHALALRVAA